MRILKIVFLSIIFTSSAPAIAGVYTDDLSRCLVESSTSEDKLTLVKWMFTGMALHPTVKPMAPITEEQRDGANKNAAKLFVRLLTETCVAQTKNAVKYEGQLAIQSSFQVFGQVAGKELLTNPDVAAGMSGLEKHFDSDKLNEVLGIAKE